MNFFATHAGTPEDPDGFPDYGEAGSTRVFDNDMGWEIALGEIYVTTAAIRLVRCGEASGASIEMYWGTCPEDFIATMDRETLPLGAITTDDGSYCGVEVVYAPYVIDVGEEEHVSPENPDVVGNTILITGVARRPIDPDTLEEVPFSIVSTEQVSVQIDISTLQGGGPVKLNDESFARHLIVLKQYDQFFSGVDFSTASAAELEAAVLGGLETGTVVYDGPTIPD